MVIHLKLIIWYSTSSIVYDLLSFATLPLSVMEITVMQFILLLGLSCKEIHAMNSCRIPSCVMSHADYRHPKKHAKTVSKNKALETFDDDQFLLRRFSPAKKIF